jgi:hypothetical protein
MDMSKIVVLLLTLVSVVFLVWIEVKSRRNSRAASPPTPAQDAAKQTEQPKKVH